MLVVLETLYTYFVGMLAVLETSQNYDLIMKIMMRPLSLT